MLNAREFGGRPPRSVRGAATSLRVPAVDTVRGLALHGIAVVNLPFLAQPASALMPRFEGWDLLARFLVSWLAEGKFFVLFSFLFGWGFAAQLHVPPEIAPHARRRLWRRLAGLAAIGVAHATLVFHGDILVLYAVLGVPLQVLHGASSRRLLAVAAGGVLMWAVTLGALTLLTPTLAAAVPPPDTAGYLGTFADAVRQRTHDWPVAFVVVLLFNGPMALAAFCVGVLAARGELFAPGSALAARLRQHAPRLAVAGLTLNLWYALASVGLLGSGPMAVLGGMSLAIGGPCLSAAYLAGALALAGRAGPFVAAAGRMSLTVYVLEGVIAGLIFNGYGLGLYGRLGAAGTLLLAPVVYLVAAGAALAWQQTGRRGPLEAVLRAISGPMPRGGAS